MRHLGAATCLLLTLSTDISFAQAYSFKNYVTSHGGCGEHRTILDTQLTRIATDSDRLRYVNQPLAIDLFGKPAADWVENDISDAEAVWFSCERQIAEKAYSGALESPQAALIRREIDKDIMSRWEFIEVKIRSIIDNGRKSQQNAAAKQVASARMHAAAQQQQQDAEDRLRRENERKEVAAREDADRQVNAARIRAEKDRADAADMRRQLQIEQQKLAEAAGIASDAERERREVEDALEKVRSARQAEEQRVRSENQRRNDSATAHETESKPVAARDSCSITLGAFNDVRYGMSLEQVEAALGCKGTLNNSTKIPGVGLSEIYSWTTKDATGVITAEFNRRRLNAKSQLGLN